MSYPASESMEPYEGMPGFMSWRTEYHYRAGHGRLLGDALFMFDMVLLDLMDLALDPLDECDQRAVDRWLKAAAK